MSPNLSFEHIALVLALAGCSKATPAADTSSTVRSDPSASAPAEKQGEAPPPVIGASAVATTATPGSPAPRGAASAIELRKKEKDTTGQASCGAGNCTSEIKKK